MKVLGLILLFAGLLIFAGVLGTSCQSSNSSGPSFPNALETIVGPTKTPCGYPGNTCTPTITNTPTSTATATVTPTHTCAPGETQTPCP